MPDEQVGGLGQPVDVGGQPPGVVQIFPDSDDAIAVSSTESVFGDSGSGQFLLSMRRRRRSNIYPVSR